MKFIETAVQGAYVIELERIVDERGFFARAWSGREFAERGLDPSLAQCNVSHNTRAATLRGLHYQAAPHEETKLIRCTRGALFDVVVDIRPDSPTYLKWDAYELTRENLRMMYLPKGVAHGFQTLEPETEIFYQMGTEYTPGAARGIRWDDPTFNIPWPLPDPVMNDRDRELPFLSPRS